MTLDAAQTTPCRHTRQHLSFPPPLGHRELLRTILHSPLKEQSTIYTDTSDRLSRSATGETILGPSSTIQVNWIDGVVWVEIDLLVGIDVIRCGMIRRIARDTILLSILLVDPHIIDLEGGREVQGTVSDSLESIGHTKVHDEIHGLDGD